MSSSAVSMVSRARVPVAAFAVDLLPLHAVSRHWVNLPPDPVSGVVEAASTTLGMPRSLAIADAGSRLQACLDAAEAGDAATPDIASANTAAHEVTSDANLIALDTLSLPRKAVKR